MIAFLVVLQTRSTIISKHRRSKMEEENKSKAKCSTKVSKKDSLVIFGLSLVLFALLIVRVEFVNKRAEVMEAKLEKRIQRIEDEMQGKVHSILKEIFQTERNPTKRSSRNFANMGKSQTTACF